MKISVLVIASDNLSIYKQHEACWRSYATSHPNIDVYFIRQREGVSSTYLDGDTIWSNGRETTERVFEKTVAAFKFLHNSSYDFLVRTNLSSVWNFTKLYNFCRSLPRNNVFCGVLGNPGISGAGMIITPDVVEELVKHSEDIERCMWDDIDFGKITVLCGIPSIPAIRYDPKSIQDVERCWHLGYHYYVKHMISGKRDVKTEIDVMKHLIFKIYGHRVQAYG